MFLFVFNPRVKRYVTISQCHSRLSPTRTGNLDLRSEYITDNFARLNYDNFREKDVEISDTSSSQINATSSDNHHTTIITTMTIMFSTMEFMFKSLPSDITCRLVLRWRLTSYNYSSINASKQLSIPEMWSDGNFHFHWVSNCGGMMATQLFLDLKWCQTRSC